MRRGIVLGGILLAVLVTVAWWLLIIQPRNDDVDQVNREVEDAVAQEDQLRSQILALSAIKVQETSYLFAIGQMEAAIPVTPEADAFIEQINFLAQRTGVDLLSLTLAPPTQSAGEDQVGFEIQVAVSIEGEYFEVLGFLYGLEELERIVRVDTMTINPLAAASTEESDEPEEGAEDTDPTDEPRPRPQTTLTQVNLGATLFTRTGVVLPEEDEESTEGETTTTTTTTAPTTTTTAPGSGGDE